MDWIPDKSINFPESTVLSDIVRKYAAALIRNYGILPYEYPKRTEHIGTMEFGDDTKALHADARRKKRHKSKVGNNYYVESVIDKYIPYEDTSIPPARLAELARQAKQAMRRASELAGEDVIYCCAAIRIKRLYKCPIGCQKREHYKIINGNA